MLGCHWYSHKRVVPISASGSNKTLQASILLSTPSPLLNFIVSICMANPGTFYKVSLSLSVIRATDICLYGCAPGPAIISVYFLD